MPLITFTSKGIFCRQANVYIDPWKPVKNAFITHGHADHARYGSKKYLATHPTVPIVNYRLNQPNITGIDFGETITVNGVKFSFHPAGHIIGSAQIRVEYKDEIWVVSGDYKVASDGISEDFEPVKCHHFITESTFGLPIFKWAPQSVVMDQINDWWKKNKEEGRVSVINAYSLGKAQRVINNVDHSIGKVLTHGAVENTNEILRSNGINIFKTERVTTDHNFDDFNGNLVVAPPSALGSAWVKKFKNYSSAAASGWMAMRGTRRRRGTDRGFVLSDHADWDGLNKAIEATGAEHIYVTHGYTEIFSKWLKSNGYESQIIKTEYSGDEEIKEDSES